jgi:glycosyltransferase involved in cell wall biosynthesis
MKRLLVVQYSGDYREAHRRLTEDGSEVYYGHRYVLDRLQALGDTHGKAAILCCLAPPHVETLPGGVTVMGAGTRPDLDPAAIIRRIADYDPTHLIVHGPMQGLIRWGMRQDIRVGCVFADSFARGRLYRWLRFGRLPGLLNDPKVSLVANHGVNAGRALVSLGVRADRVIPWDYPHVRTPDQWPAKTLRSGARHTLLYVGSVEEKKGVGDLIQAVAMLAGRIDLRLKIVGAGQIARFVALAAKLGITDRVDCVGLVPNGEIPGMMHAADVVVVPSRHAFPEGLPLTLYEALASRTPVIASDHPMFVGHLVDGESALVIPASRPRALADAIERLLGDPALYARVSAGSPLAWQRMQVPVRWGDMIDSWMRDTPESRAWLAGRVAWRQLDVHRLRAAPRVLHGRRRDVALRSSQGASVECDGG